MAVEPRLMTADELARLPGRGSRHELVRGELRTMLPSGFELGGITLRTGSMLASYVVANHLGEVVAGDVGFQLTTNPDTIRAPDVPFVAAERLPHVGAVRGYWQGAPDLAVEVISPNDLYTEVDEKVAEWLEHGVRLLFVVNPRRRTVAVHRPGRAVRILTEADLLDGEDVVPGWTLPVRDLFVRPAS